MSIVTIRVRSGREFHVHKEVLTADSAYFDKALNGHFAETKSQTIDLDDVTSRDFGFYVAVQYKLSQRDAPVELAKKEGGLWFAFSDLAYLWQLADRFINTEILRIAEAAMKNRLQHFSVAKWLRRYEFRDSAYIERHLKALQKGFRVCKEEFVPFDQELVTAFSNCPPQVFAEHVGFLDEEYKDAVTEAFALRHADPKITEKKRKRDEATQESAKKQKQ